MQKVNYCFCHESRYKNCCNYQKVHVEMKYTYLNKLLAMGLGRNKQYSELGGIVS